MPRPVLAAVAVTTVLVACDRDPVRPGPGSLPQPPAKASTAIALAAPTAFDAVAISQTIQTRHVPYGTVVDPIFADSNPNDFTLSELGYDRAADAGIWTGHYLAAEALRYKATGEADALSNAQRAIAAITTLLDATGADGGANVLARFAVPAGAPYATEITTGESQHGIYSGTVGTVEYKWLGNTSRDQYSGVFFGLGVAYDMIEDVPTRAAIQRNVERMLDYLLKNGWYVVLPGGSISTTFVQRPEQQLSFLQVGRRVNPAKYGATYASYRSRKASSVPLPIATECMDVHNSYYKFNLDYINLYNLIRLEESTSSYRKTYLSAYNTLRNCTGSHQNAHFNMIDRGIKGTANATRDAETVNLLSLWLERRRRDYPTDVTAQYSPLCGTNRACRPVAVNERPNTDFLWQRSPFLLAGGGDGTVAAAGIDYILPYWMARIYGVLGP